MIWNIFLPRKNDRPCAGGKFNRGRRAAGTDDLKSASNSSSVLRLGEEMIAMTVCRHAVKANDPLRYLEVEKLIQDLLECDLPYCCPHGRPTMIQISLSELEKKFGRKA